MGRPDNVPALETRIGLHLTARQRLIAERLAEQHKGNISEAIRRLIESAAIRPLTEPGGPDGDVLQL